MNQRAKGGGIYQIRHIATGRRYIGSAVNFAKRFDGHRSRLGRGSHHAPILQALWTAHGAEAFAFELLELIDDPAQLVDREQAYIDGALAQGRTRLLNACLIAGSSLGRTDSPETRAKKSTALKGRPKSPEHAAKVGARHRGKAVSEETKAKLRAHNLGKACGVETRTKLSAHFSTIERTTVWRARISAGLRGKRHAPAVYALIEEHKKERRRIVAVHRSLHELA